MARSIRALSQARRVPGLPGEREDEMIQVLLEVRAGATRFQVAARAWSIQRAVSIAGAIYPGGEVRLVVPIEPETFFVEDASPKSEFVEFQMPQSMAA